MTFSFVCVVTPSKKEERISHKEFLRNKSYWFHADGRRFTEDEANTQWSNSTFRWLQEASGNFLYELCDGENQYGVRLNTPRAQAIISKMKEYVQKHPPNIPQRQEPTPDILNLIATFDIMVARFGDGARFAVL